jgi:AcrR family transcriptional regulator
MRTTERPLRADAERNRRRIMDAARELFALRGLDVTLNDIAHHAGVGVGTVYRRFPDKDVLIEALFEERVAELEAIARAGLEIEDPWEGLVATITGVLELQEADRGLKELILSVGRDRDGTMSIRARMAPIVAELMARAHATGQLREDVVPQDFPLLQILLGAVIDVGRDAAPGLWRRYLELVLQGMRVAPESPAPLTVATPAVEDMDSVLSCWRPPRRA